MEAMTKAMAVTHDVSALLRARNSVIWIVTREEARAERYLAEAAAHAGYACRTWDVAQGVCRMDGTVEFTGTDTPHAALSLIRTHASSTSEANRSVWIMRDLPVWLNGAPMADVLRNLRNLARQLPEVPRDHAQAIVVLTPSTDIPPELAGHTTLVEWPLPDRAEIAEILEGTIEVQPDDIRANALDADKRDAAVDAAIGLSGLEAQACYARSLVQHRHIDPVTVANEKKRVIARERVLEWHDPLPGGLDAVGGLENLKAWLLMRSQAYSVEARDYGLPAPKGMLAVGISGCGKSLMAKALATAWEVPLLRFDLGALKSKFVGESEGNIRKALKVVEAIGRCVLWLDEIEKALQGGSSGSADGGVSADALATLLTWMQERKCEAFVFATANDVSKLPPEVLRKGRFNEIFFVDLPTYAEREAVVRAAFKQNGRDAAKLKINCSAVADVTPQWTGAEIAELVPEAMFTAFNDGGREPTTADLIRAAKTVVPLSTTAKEKIDALRAWADEGRARRATKADEVRPSKPAPTKRKAPVLEY